MERAPGRIHAAHVFPAIVLLFVVQPALAALSATATDFLVVLLALTLAVGIWSLDGGRTWTRVGVAISAAAALTVIAQRIAPRLAFVVAGTLWLDLLGLLCVLLGIRWLASSRRITLESLLAAISLYVLLAIVFAMLALGIFVLDPGAYHGLSESGRSKEVAELVYFSIGTLTGTAYGDILPTGPLSRLLANAEAVTGQMYMAVLVAMLVSNYVAGRSAEGS